MLPERSLAIRLSARGEIRPPLLESRPSDQRGARQLRDANSSALGTEPGRPVYVYGAGGHSQVVSEVLAEMGFTVKAFIDDHPERAHPAVTRTIPGRLVSGAAEFPELDAPLVLALGNCRKRKELAELLDVQWISAIHSTATIASTVEMGVDNVVLHRAVIQANTRIGSHVLINTAASIDHDNVIGNYSHISPHATLCGHVRIGEGTHVGAAATVIPEVKIGAWCTVGAGSVVIEDLPDHSTAVGVPARIIRAGA